VQFGLLISVLLHVALLGGALFSIHSRQELRLPETEPVAVGMITPGEATKVKQGVRTAKLLEAAEAKDSPKGDQAKKESARPKMAAAAPPPPPPSAAPEEKKAPPAPPKVADPPPAPPPAASEEAKKKLADEQRLAAEKKQAEEQAKAEALQRAEAQKLAEEKKRLDEEQKLADERKRAEELKKRQDEERRLKLARERKERQRKAAEAARKRKLEEEKARHEAEAAKAKQFDADKIAALLNKVPDAAPPPPSTAGDQPTKNKGPTLGAPEGKDRQLSASERALIGQIIKSCVEGRWTVLSGGASAQETVVKIRLRFNQDGTLSAPPEIKPPPGAPTPYFRAISESALRAVQECEPYDLPPDLYDHWKDVIMSFSPKDMY
jgi:colicin import membrane protein